MGELARPRRDGPGAPAARRDGVPADGGDRAARRARARSPSASAAGCRAPRPTAPSRSGSTSRARSSPTRGGAPTTRRTCARRPTCRPDDIEPLVDGLRLVTIAPELPGALELIGWLARARDRGVAGPLGGDLDEARAGYAAGAPSTTHLFNAMTGVDHRAPGLAVAALERRRRLRRADRRRRPRPSGAVAAHRPAQARRPAAAGQRRDLARRDRRRPRRGSAASRSRSSTAAGDAGRDDDAGRVGHRARQRGAQPGGRRASPLPAAVAAAGANPLALLGVTDRGRIAVGQRADLVELDDDLRVRRVMRGGDWFETRIGVTERRPRLEIRPFAPEVVDDAARLLADRHRAQRLVEPALDARLRGRRPPPAPRSRRSPPRTVRPAPSPCAAATVVGYLSARRGRRSGARTCGSRAPVTRSTEPEIVRDLYGLAAGGWVEAGATEPLRRRAGDGPGRSSTPGSGRVRPAARPRDPRARRRPARRSRHRPGSTIRRAERRDIPVLGRLELGRSASTRSLAGLLDGAAA